MWLYIVIFSTSLHFLNAQGLYNYNINDISSDLYYDQLRCPEHWVKFQQSCYRFIKSPLRSYGEGRRICQ
ncbi:hypothetical protein ILUMI_18144, partial [Ignelater luminosus]